MRKWIAFWCAEGFEYLDEITQYEHWEHKQLIDVLSDRKPKPNPLNQTISFLKLRARANIQRNYELYVFSSDPGIELESLKSWSENDPQSLVNWIRKNGIELYSDRNLNQKRVIV